MSTTLHFIHSNGPVSFSKSSPTVIVGHQPVQLLPALVNPSQRSCQWTLTSSLTRKLTPKLTWLCTTHHLEDPSPTIANRLSFPETFLNFSFPSDVKPRFGVGLNLGSELDSGLSGSDLGSAFDVFKDQDVAFPYKCLLSLKLGGIDCLLWGCHLHPSPNLEIPSLPPDASPDSDPRLNVAFYWFIGDISRSCFDLEFTVAIILE